MKVSDDELCPFCQDEEESSLHILAKCTAKSMSIQRDVFGLHTLDFKELSRVAYFGCFL